MSRTKKHMYRVVHKGYIVEGLASTPGNACRLAFKKLIEANLIKQVPKTTYNNASTFEDTTVGVIDENES